MKREKQRLRCFIHNLDEQLADGKLSVLDALTRTVRIYRHMFHDHAVEESNTVFDGEGKLPSDAGDYKNPDTTGRSVKSIHPICDEWDAQTQATIDGLRKEISRQAGSIRDKYSQILDFEEVSGVNEQIKNQLRAHIEELQKEIHGSQKLTGSEALYGFCAWLTTRKKTTNMGGTLDNCGEIPPLITEFCEVNGLVKPRTFYTDNLTLPRDENKPVGGMKDPEASQAFKELKRFMKNDPEYAEGWHANIAMSCYDSISKNPWHNLSHLRRLEIGREAAKRFMKLCFDVETGGDDR